MKNSSTMNGIAVTVLVAVVVGCYLLLHPAIPSIPRAPYLASGELLAAEAQGQLPPGGRLIVIARDSDPFLVPASEAQLDGFLQALKRKGQSPAIIRRIKLDPLRIMAVPPGDFYDLLRQGKENDLIVSFLGPPLLDAEQSSKIPAKHPKVLAVCLGSTLSSSAIKRLFDQHLLSAALVWRTNTVSPATTPANAAGSDFPFKLITVSNLADLPGFSAVAN